MDIKNPSASELSVQKGSDGRATAQDIVVIDSKSQVPKLEIAKVNTLTIGGAEINPLSNR